jgi:hypothetical protein
MPAGPGRCCECARQCQQPDERSDTNRECCHRNLSFFGCCSVLVEICFTMMMMCCRFIVSSAGKDMNRLPAEHSYSRSILPCSVY